MNNIEITRPSNEVYAVMTPILRLALFAACLVGLANAAPVQAQTSATLNVTARVIEQCTISVRARKALILLALRTGRRDILQKCSKGVVSRIDQRSVASARLQPRFALPSRIKRTRVVKKALPGGSDVVLVTVTY